MGRFDKQDIRNLASREGLNFDLSDDAEEFLADLANNYVYAFSKASQTFNINLRQLTSQVVPRKLLVPVFRDIMMYSIPPGKISDFAPDANLQEYLITGTVNFIVYILRESRPTKVDWYAGKVHVTLYLYKRNIIETISENKDFLKVYDKILEWAEI